MTTPDHEEGYDGTAVLLSEEHGVEVEVSLRGGFQPIDGRYHWYGRVAADDAVESRFGSGADVVVRTPQGEALGRLSDVDPWGRLRITGTGRPPFAADDDVEA
jgi:hypothetical protein